MRLLINPGGALRGQISIASDKSISHRAVMFGALSNGISRVGNLLKSDDVLATIGGFRQMGVSIEEKNNNQWEINGVGLYGLKQPVAPLDLGNSGTALRLLTGLMCAQPWKSVLTGDASLRSRPMKRIIDPLVAMGAHIESEHGKPPLVVHPVAKLRGVRYLMPIASAQVKSCLLLAGLYAEGATMVVEPVPTRDHTERMLRVYGMNVEKRNGEIRLDSTCSKRDLQAVNIAIPADLSAAAFFMVGASIVPNSEVLLKNIGINPSRSGVLTILKKMGADIRVHNQTNIGSTPDSEPVADISVRSTVLHGCQVNGDEAALAIDEIPIIAMAAACAEGVTEIRGVSELRVKESDRISGVAAGLTSLGVAVEEHSDGLTITGGSFRGGRVDSRGDHRLAMAFAIAGGAAQASVEVMDCKNITTSFPKFCQVANDAGLNIKIG